MAVSFIAAGSVATASATTLTIAAPSGLTGDLLVFILMHDDASDSSAGMSATVAPVAVTALAAINYGAVAPAGQFDDSSCYVWYCVHDQDAGENWTFGTLGATEELKGVCLRFRGQHANTPILPGSLMVDARRALRWWPSTFSDEWGSMYVGVRWDDGAPGTQTPPTGWDERVDSSATNNSLYVATRAVTTYGQSTFSTGDAATGDQMGALSFTIQPAAGTTFTVAGVTRDGNGDPLPSCQVSLFRHRASGVMEYVSTQTSHGTTGAYSFTVPEDSANFMVYAQKSGSPNVYDATDLNLDPT